MQCNAMQCNAMQCNAMHVSTADTSFVTMDHILEGLLSALGADTVLRIALICVEDLVSVPIAVTMLKA